MKNNRRGRLCFRKEELHQNYRSVGEKLPEAFSVLTKKPLVTLAVVAAVPVLVMLAFTFKSGYTPGAKGGKFDKIVVVKTPTEIADEATAALQKTISRLFGCLK